MVDFEKAVVLFLFLRILPGTLNAFFDMKTFFYMYSWKLLINKMKNTKLNVTTGRTWWMNGEWG